MSATYNVSLLIGYDTSISNYIVTANVSSTTSSNANCISSSSIIFYGGSGIQCNQWGNLVFQFNPLPNPTTLGACALVNWTSNANNNPSTILSNVNDSISNFSFYNGPIPNFELDIGVSPTYRQSFQNLSNVNAYCSSILNDFNYFQNPPSLIVNINLNLYTTVNQNTFLGQDFGGVIGLASSGGNVTYNLTYTNYANSVTKTIRSNGNQYFTFPNTIYTGTSVNYTVSSSPPDVGNIFGLFDGNVAGSSSAIGNYNANLNTQTLFQISGNILQSCAEYSITSSSTNPASTPIYSFMPATTNPSNKNFIASGGISNTTVSCVINNFNESACDSICLANCNSLFVSSNVPITGNPISS